jgi:quercetin dioxygenase-like cupin family protein
VPEGARRCRRGSIAVLAAYDVPVQFWELDDLGVAAHEPRILRSDDDASRVIALLLPQGESLQEHQVHEHTLVFVVQGQLRVSAGASNHELSAPSLIHFEPAERHEVSALSDCQLVLCLAPWPGPRHPSQTRPSPITLRLVTSRRLGIGDIEHVELIAPT